MDWLPDTDEENDRPFTARTYVESYLADPDQWWWTTDLSTQPDKEQVLQRVLAIIDGADISLHAKALGQLGAGPLENMMSHALLDRLSHLAPFSPAMKLALSSVRIEAEPAAIQERLAILMRN